MQMRDEILESVLKLFQLIVKISSAILSLIVFAYIIGWFVLESYFGKFGGSWITNDVTIFDILSNSIIPIGALLFTLYIGLLDIYENKDSISKFTYLIFRCGLFIIVPLLLVSGFLENSVYKKLNIFFINSVGYYILSLCWCRC